MKHTAFILCLTLSISAQMMAQETGSGNILKDIKGLVKPTDTSVPRTDIASGLKEALMVGAELSGKKLSAVDGFFGNAVLKILLPPEAVKVEQKLRGMGLGKQVDQAILTVNRAAEDAAKSAAPIFIQAIREMTIQDAAGILRGGDTAATSYLRGRTSLTLTEAFRPVIDKSLEKVGATRHWNTIFNAYNRFAREKVNPDLAGYVTDRALYGIFMQLGEEERKIRKDPLARTTDLLRRVFGKN